MQALILTEGGLRNGFGHITRCRALQEALRAEGVDVSLVVNGDASVKKQFRINSKSIFNWLKDKTRIERMLKQKDIVMVDSYLAPLEIYKRISQTVLRPVYVDDFLRLSYPRGIVVRGAINAEKASFPQKIAGRYLVGANYMLLRPEFANVPRKKNQSQIKDVLLTFGGMDYSGLIHKLLAVLSEKFPRCRFHVISARPRGHKVFSNARFYAGLSASQMLALMGRCDAAISGGGQTLNELAACGVPTIGILLAENQRRNIQGWKRHGFLKYAGSIDSLNVVGRISKCLKEIAAPVERERMSRVGQNLVDGKGARRVAREIMASPIQLRPMQPKDCRQVFQWANERDVRDASFDTQPISWASHRVWFKNVVQDKKTLFYKVLWFDRPMGQVRFAIQDDAAKISVSLARAYRGKGLGALVLQCASKILFSESSVRVIKAFIKLGNRSSLKAFQKAGFQFDALEKVQGQKARVLVLKRISHG